MMSLPDLGSRSDLRSLGRARLGGEARRARSRRGSGSELVCAGGDGDVEVLDVLGGRGPDVGLDLGGVLVRGDFDVGAVGGADGVGQDAVVADVTAES